MAVLTAAEMNTLMLKRAQLETSTNDPLATADKLSFLNEGYSDVYEISGGRLKRVPSSTAWQSAELATGLVFGLLTDIANIEAIFATTTAPAAITSTTSISSQTVTSSAAFANVKPGMAVSGTGITTGSYVIAVASTSSLTISLPATAAGTVSLTYSPAGGPTDTSLRRVERSRIEFLRAAQGHGTYNATPKLYSVTGIASEIAGEVNKLQLDYFPSVTGFYFPLWYTRQFVPLTALSTEVPDLNDLESRDAALIAAARLAGTMGRTDLVPGILADVSNRTAKALERKLTALAHGRQDA